MDFKKIFGIIKSLLQILVATGVIAKSDKKAKDETKSVV